MNPQSVTVGARLGRRLNATLIIPAASRAPDTVAFLGGLLASIAGGIAATIGPQSAAELLRIALAKLDGQPQLELPPGVRLAIAAAEEVSPVCPMCITPAECGAAGTCGKTHSPIDA